MQNDYLIFKIYCAMKTSFYPRWFPAIVLLCLIGCQHVPQQTTAPHVVPAVSFENNSQLWHARNDHLMPDKIKTQAILALKQERDFTGSDIDADGVPNERDPSPFDWREIGYQPFGMLEFLSWCHAWNNNKFPAEDLPKVTKLLQDIGVACVRMDFIWEDIEPRQGAFDFAKYDEIVGELSKSNIRILGLLDYCALWAGPRWNGPPNNPDDFVRFASRVIERYRDKVKYWEIWNEPDSRIYWQPQDDMKSYAELLKRCYRAAKRIDPSCTIVLGGLTNQGYYALKNIYRNGGKDFFDVINIHPFVNPLEPESLKRLHTLYSNVEKLKASFGDYDKKIWFTEIGCPGLAPGAQSQGWWEGASPTEKEQAEFLSLVYTDVIQLPTVEKVFWAFLRDNLGHFGTDVDYFGLLRWNYSAKPAFSVFKERYEAWRKEYEEQGNTDKAR